MKSRELFYGVMFILLFAFATGCTRVRTYTVETNRVDQNLREGNRGYFMGQPKDAQMDQERRLTRKTYVTEIEVGSAPKTKKRISKRQTLVVETVQEPASEPMKEESEGSVGVAKKATSYTVQNNDTLQKISIAVYGSSKQWKKIFEANSDQLKSPDKIYAGQILKIPQE